MPKLKKKVNPKNYKMKENLLPNYFKKIGLITGLIFFILLFLVHFYPEQNPFSINQLKIEWIIKDLILMSLLFIAFSKEKDETDKILGLRFHKLKESVLFGGIMIFYDSISVFGYNENDQLKSGFEIIVMILLFYIITFHLKKKRLRKARA
jgi:succinate dehydrogenase/fumarate reductase cytochrome b subunit